MEEVSAIIKSRKHGGLVACFIVILVIAFMSWQSESRSNHLDLGIIVAGVFILGLFICIYAINIFNYPVPKPYYRKFNKILYIYIAKVAVVFSALGALRSTKRLVNPLEGLGHPDDKIEDLLTASAEAGTAYTIAKQIKPAQIIEQYYVQQQSVVLSQTPTLPSAPLPPQI